MIELKGVSKQYLYGARVLGALDLTVNDGEIVAVLGDDGGGKTSLLKCIAGATDCEGEALVDGAPIKKKPDNVQFVFDDLALFARRTGFYNLAYPLKIRGVDKEKIRETVLRVASELDMTACLYERVKDLPLIDLKRLAMARLLMREASNILIDDITSGLPQGEARELWGQLVPILLKKAKAGATVIYSTKNREEALSIADRIVVVSGGEVKQIGAFDEIYSSPANVWAAQAADERFHVEGGELTSEGDRLVVKLEEGGRVDVSHLKGRALPSYIGKRVLVGWHADCFDVGGDRREKTLYAVREGDSYVNYTEGGKQVVLPEARDEVCVCPFVDKVMLFDANNENSILL